MSYHAEMLAVRAQTEVVATAAEAARARAAIAPEEKPAEEAGPEVLLEISAAGDYKLGEKTLSFEELKDALLAEHFDKGPNLLVVITAQPETPYKRVSQALEAAECASITKTKLRNAPKPAE